ncbi:MAG: hypothetical protein GY859_40215 [Desulfobacterales bacterium]|nr:hypothetical protein [Desulfobacterales bacterium]
MKKEWKETAWNGIRFSAPPDWAPAVIDPAHLLLEREARPVMEIKWWKIKGSFSHKRALRRLTSLHGKRSGKTLEERPLPPGWKKSLTRFEATCFSWRGADMAGQGAILHHPGRGGAVMVQFFSPAAHPDARERVLASLRDHGADDQVLWSVFDIRARIPRPFALAEYRFQPGRFKIGFKTATQNLTLHRWAPASILLENKDLSDFLNTLGDYTRGERRQITAGGRPCLDWSLVLPDALLSRILRRIKKQPAFQRFRLRRVEEKNRIMGVSASGKRPGDYSLMERVWSEYEIT